MKSATQKLSKADRDTSVRDLRDAGWTADAIIGRAAASVGLTASEHPLPADDVAGLFPRAAGLA
jgi:hypothetical protein